MGYCRYLRFESRISYLYGHQQCLGIIFTSLLMPSNMPSSSEFFCTSCEGALSVHHICSSSCFRETLAQTGRDMYGRESDR